MVDPIKILRERGGSVISPLRWSDNRLFLLDQRLLPHKEEWIEVNSWQGAYNAIADMVVRGAPAIGIVAAFGMVLGLKRCISDIKAEDDILKCLVTIGEGLRSARPTAVNLSWAVNRIIKKARRGFLCQNAYNGYNNNDNNNENYDIDNYNNIDADNLLSFLEKEAVSIWREDIISNIEMGKNGLELIKKCSSILTHCNAGALATGGYGTALGVIRYAHFVKKGLKVFADETRPWLQGSRLTAWELMKDGIDVHIICDNAVGLFMRQGKIDAVIVGADRIALNGDVANKIGTYQVAVMAKEHSIPFYVAAPFSTVDISISSGALIPIEERDEREVLTFDGLPIAPSGIRARNPVFDITPNHLITAIITEKGVLTPPYEKKLMGQTRQL